MLKHREIPFERPAVDAEYAYTCHHINHNLVIDGAWSDWMRGKFMDALPQHPTETFALDCLLAFDWLRDFHQSAASGRWAYIVSEGVPRYHYWFETCNLRQVGMAVIRAMVDNIRGDGLHFSVCTIDRAKSYMQGITYEDCPRHYWLWSEIDNFSEKQSGLKALPYTPFAIKGREDGSGYYLYWRLDTGVDVPESGSLFQRTNQGIGAFTGDIQGASLRHMRLPGSRHSKSGRGNFRFQWQPLEPEYFGPTRKSVYALSDFAHLARPEARHSDDLQSEEPSILEGDRLVAYVRGAIRSECEALRFTSRGNRNEPLYNASFRIGSIVGTTGLDVEALRDLTQASIQAGHDRKQAWATANSGLSAGKEHPRHK